MEVEVVFGIDSVEEEGDGEMAVGRENEGTRKRVQFRTPKNIDSYLLEHHVKDGGGLCIAHEGSVPG